MLAWVCWDEFVNLKSPYKVRWMEKCNESHIAALRIMMRDTLSRAVASREHNLTSGSIETGHLMSSLLMAAMSKLAAMRTTAPVVLDTAEDTVTKLMRGLFGNLMTIAGSGVRPLSMVWQLFGLNPQYDVPVTDADWVWYENVVELYPYTGWPIDQFHSNLAKLLDKIILRVITKNENVAETKMSRVADMVRYCKLRNIQLEHSRTIITVFERMLTAEGLDVPAVAARLVEMIPSKLEKQTKSYARMVKYVSNLAKGCERRAAEDLIYASIYTKRSAAFKDLKTTVAKACEEGDWATATAGCQDILDKHQQIAAMWHVEPEKLKVQNLKVYRELIDADLGEDVDQETKNATDETIKRILNDAEKQRVPWRVGNEDASDGEIEPLDESFIEEVLIGKAQVSQETVQEEKEKAVMISKAPEQVGFDHYKSSLAPSFISTMEKTLSAEDVCTILKVPVGTMRVFVHSLNPGFAWEDLGGQFKIVVLELLRQRSNRIESRPACRMLMME